MAGDLSQPRAEAGNAVNAKPFAAAQRVPLGRSARRLSFERRLRLAVWCFGLPFLLGLLWTVQAQHAGAIVGAASVIGFGVLWWIVVSLCVEQVTRPLQTLSNIVAALREDDFSFRARGAIRGDSLGDLAMEINTLAASMQAQRNAAMDALTLADRVIGSMHSPVLAFDANDRLRLFNAAAERVFRFERDQAVGRTAAELHMAALVSVADEAVVTLDGAGRQTAGVPPRFSVRRATFRLHGVPQTLLVLSDVAAALREEERSAWQRLIRVLSHEINNSLTPIKSMASMLRARPLHLDAKLHSSQDLSDVLRGLAMIEERADSLNRFLQSYQQLSRLPAPQVRAVSLADVVERTVLLERRVPIRIAASADIMLRVDPDQIQQMLINLLKNAAEAVLEAGSAGSLQSSATALQEGVTPSRASNEHNRATPAIQVSWHTADGVATLLVQDDGPGLANPANLFVPFYTTKPEGSGIGLTLCRQIAAAHGGTIHLRNRTGATGCIAEVTLPVVEAAAA